MKRALIIDDNASNIYLIRFILEKQGFQVIEAKKGIDGVEMALHEKPDIILMDIQLPDIDGLEATRRIRASEANGNVPIIAVTSYAMPGDRQMVLAAGCNSYITKPIDIDDLVAEIGKYV